MSISLIKSVLHNVGVLFVGLVFAFLCRRLDVILGVKAFHFLPVTITGYLLLAAGFLLRVWATFYFYQRKMDVIRLVPQAHLITGGPYRFSRNPLYLGGNGLIFGGAALLAGSPSGVVLTALNVVLVDRVMVRREERQLASQFGAEWTQYRSRIRRWM
jgi:protein-S-isoprenylcysteine O-methyltransferase Ste14